MMKHKIISLVAMIVSICAFVAAVALLIFNLINELPNTGAFIFQLVALTLIVLLCVGNYIFTCFSLKAEEEAENKDEQEEITTDDNM